MMLCVGSDKIHLNNGFLSKDKPCVHLDVNGIAQGYSVDVIADFLNAKGIHNFIVELGGELRVKGHKPTGEQISIGIEGPGNNDFDPLPIQRIVHIGDGALTTSGNYRKYYLSGGRRISHLIDARTGYPIQNELISVTVYAKDGITADGYDNALMGMGLKKAIDFVEHRSDMEAYFIYHKANGAVADTATRGFYKFMR
jgi:thiamine biosynthesis lipoprotein